MRKIVTISILLPLLLATLSFVAASDAFRSIKRVEDLSHDSGQLGSYHALVIGINQYKDPKIPDLATAVSDATALADILVSHYDFKVKTLLDEKATWNAIDRSLRDLTTVDSSDSVLIYFAGHGELDRVYNDGWWVPSDAVFGEKRTYLDNTLVQKALRNIRARHVLLVSDSCYSGSLFGEVSRAMPQQITDKYYLSLYNEKSRWGMTSGNKEPVSDQGSGGHSVFAYHLLKTLKENPKPFLSTQEIYTRIAPIVSNNSDQTPICRPVRNTGDQGGEFVFVMINVQSALSPTPQGRQDAPPPAMADKEVIFWESIKDSTNPAAFEAYLQQFPKGTYAVLAQIRLDELREPEVLSAPEPPKVVPARLFVVPDPPDARIRILNIGPRFRQGIELDPGRYHVEVSARGYETKKTWVSLEAGEEKRTEIGLYEEPPTAPAPPAAPATRPAPQPVAPAKPPAGTAWREPTTGMEFAYVPGGCYQMGCGSWASDCDDDEKPVHEVCLDGFWMGKYEVTQGQWLQVMGSNPTQLKRGDDYPVEKVSWNDAKEFIGKLNDMKGGGFTLRLPTEAEWEYACRSGGKPEIYAGGASVDQIAWHIGNSGNATHLVGTKAPNRLGIYDMSGNVWEWCEDLYDKRAYRSHSRDNPVNDRSGSCRVRRGGSWYRLPKDGRSTDRNCAPLQSKFFDLGFRMAWTP